MHDTGWCNKCGHPVIIEWSEEHEETQPCERDGYNGEVRLYFYNPRPPLVINRKG